jgi:hypothetical protein
MVVTRLTGECFEDLRNTGPDQVIEDYDLDRCTVVVGRLAQRTSHTPSLVVRRVNATQCTLDNCLAVGVRFEDVTFDNIVTKGGLTHFRGCVLSHVMFKGRAGSIMVSSPIPRPDEDDVRPEAHQALVDAYKSVDWALDITQAEFVDVALHFVPGDLVRRDPETQFLVRREHRAELANRNLPDGTARFFSLFDVIPFDSMVMVAPKRSRHFRSLLTRFEGLRKVGLAE